MKTPTDWSSNPSADTNEYPYDSATYAYDSSTQNYDGVVDGEGAREIDPTSWSKDAKNTTSWSSQNQPKTPSSWSEA